jgi:hypothetical protein
MRYAILLYMLCQTVLATSQKQASALPLDPATQCAHRYYYYPNLQAEYDARTNLYLYIKDGNWTSSASIPSGYRGYSLNNNFNVLIDDYDEENITQFLVEHKKKFPYNFRPRMRQVSLNP